MFKFEKLDVWERAIEYADLIYNVSREFPSEERFGLTRQLRGSAVSVSSPWNNHVLCLCLVESERQEVLCWLYRGLEKTLFRKQQLEGNFYEAKDTLWFGLLWSVQKQSWCTAQGKIPEDCVWKEIFEEPAQEGAGDLTISWGRRFIQVIRYWFSTIHRNCLRLIAWICVWASHR